VGGSRVGAFGAEDVVDDLGAREAFADREDAEEGDASFPQRLVRVADGVEVVADGEGPEQAGAVLDAFAVAAPLRPLSRPAGVRGEQPRLVGHDPLGTQGTTGGLGAQLAGPAPQQRADRPQLVVDPGEP
jgi:hypothetical protein